MPGSDDEDGSGAKPKQQLKLSSGRWAYLHLASLFTKIAANHSPGVATMAPCPSPDSQSPRGTALRAGGEGARRVGGACLDATHGWCFADLTHHRTIHVHAAAMILINHATRSATARLLSPPDTPTAITRSPSPRLEHFGSCGHSEGDFYLHP